MRTIIRDNYTPKNGDYHEKILIDEAQNKTWMFDCDGVFTPIPTTINVVDEYGSSTIDAASQRLVTETMNTASEAIQAETEAREAADRLLQEEIEEIEMSSDVVDIVGTHAELEQYDTQHLKDNDIIKVLRDETRQNQTTYYRWSTSAQDFTYVGAEGPYYTESQVDNLLDAKADKADTYTKTVTDALLDNKVDKVAGKGLSTNDFTDNDKSKLDGIEAGAEANVQSDWDQTDNTADDYIKNKPTLPTDFVGTDGTAAGTAGLVPAPATTDAGKYLKADGTWDTVSAGPTVVQTTGTSQTDVMSQVATTNMIYPSGYETSQLRMAIGKNAVANSNDTMAIGYNAAAYNNYSMGIGRDTYALTGTAIGFSATAQSNSLAVGRNTTAIANNSVAIGSYSKALSRANELSIGSGVSGTNPVTRFIANVTDPTLAQDAATKNYTDNLVINYSAINGATAPTTATEAKYIGQLYYDTTNDDMYYCSAITAQGTIPETYTYTWSQFGGGGGIPTDATFWGASYDSVNNKVTGAIYFDESGAGSTRRYISTTGLYTLKLNAPSSGSIDLCINGGAKFTITSSGAGFHNLRGLNLADPTNAQDAATKNYVDTAVSGISVPTKTSDLTNDGADGTSTYVEATDIADVVYKGTQITTTSPNIISTPMIQDGAVTAAKLGNDVNFLSLTMSTTDIGEGAPLAANTLYGVYQ